MKTVRTQGTAIIHTFNCNTCSTEYDSDEYKKITFPADRESPEITKLFDKCPICKTKVIEIITAPK